MNTLENGIYELLKAGGAIFVGSWLQRRKSRAEAEEKEIANIERIIGIWQRTAGELELKVATLNSQVSSLIEENKTLKIAHGNMQRERMLEQQELQQLRKQVGELQIKLNSTT